jgi:DNA-binding transcriptional LysR family regulator
MLYPRALGILEDLQRLEDELADADQSVAGQLLIGASTIPGTYILPQLAADFKRDFPKISFEIRISDSAAITSAVADNELFLGVVGAKIPASKILHQPFAEDQLILAAAGAADLPAEIGVAELAKLPFIVRERGSGTRRSSEALLAEQRLSLNQMNIVATLGSSAAVKEAIKAGLGVSMISRHAVREELQSGQLKEVRVGGLTMKRSFYVVTSSRRTLPKHYKEFLSRLLQKPGVVGCRGQATVTTRFFRVTNHAWETRYTSSMVVIPWTTFVAPSSRRVTIPSATACRRSWLASAVCSTRAFIS